MADQETGSSAAVDPPDLFDGVPFEAKLGDRSLFPQLEALVYVNHAAISPASLPVRQALKTYGADFGRRGLEAFPTWLAQRGRLKARLGKLLRCDAGDFAIVQSTTWGLIAVAQCFPFRSGDRIVVFKGEFPSNVTPWQRIAARLGLEVDTVDADAFRTDPDRAFTELDQALARRPALVALSLVQFQTGLRMPVAAIAERAHAVGAMLCVDAVQACGMVDIDVPGLGIDYLCVGSHKWMMGLEGTGFVYASPDAAARLEPNLAGWLSHEEPIDFLMNGPGHLRYDKPIRKTIDFLEAGNVNGAGCAALEAALILIEQIGVARIYEHVQTFHDRLEEPLVEAGFTSLRSEDPEARSGILSLCPPAGIDVVSLASAARRLGIASSIPDGVLRLSPHWPCSLDEAEQVVLSLTTACDRLRRGVPVVDAHDDW